MSGETTFVSVIPTVIHIEEAIVIIPGEEKQHLAHPHLFSSGRFGYRGKREIQISPSRYFNQRLFNNSKKFGSDSDFIFLPTQKLTEIAI